MKKPRTYTEILTDEKTESDIAEMVRDGKIKFPEGVDVSIIPKGEPMIAPKFRKK